MHYVALDSRLHILEQRDGNLEAVLEAVARYESAVCAVDAPQSPNGGLLAQPEVRQQYGLRPYSTTWSQFKVCEFLLRQHGIGIYNTPLEAAEAHSWMQLGWELYDRLRGQGYQPHSPEEPPAGETRPPKTYIEVHPHACFTVLLDRFPYKKTTLVGRLQRQLLLYECRVDVPDPMEVFEEVTRHRLLAGTLEFRGLLTHDELDALVAAYTAYLVSAQPQNVSWVGDPAEGQIVVPVEKMKEKYRRGNVTRDA
jgi:predicted RNase H-like nuclease